jgi:hypothetical protein
VEYVGVLLFPAVILAAVAMIAASGIRAVGLAGGPSHPIAWIVISFGAVVMFGAAITSLWWPRPDIQGGWCGSGAVHGQYTVTTVAQTALVITVLLAPCVTTAAAVIPRSPGLRLAVTFGASLVVAIPFQITVLVALVKIGCAGS